jgi:hypothetical protein
VLETEMKLMPLVVLGLAVLASSSASAGKPCLRVGYIHNWDAVDDKTIIVEDDWRKKFRVKLIGVCNDLKFHHALAFRAISGTQLSCLGVGDQVISHEFGIGNEPCTVTQIEAYSPEINRAAH